MHTIKPYETRITLINNEGKKYLYASKAKALEELGQRFLSKIGEHFKTFNHRSYWYTSSDVYRECDVVYTHSDYIMRDDFGNVVTLADFHELICEKNSKYTKWCESLYAGYKGRGNTVPDIGRRRSHRGTYYRHPATIAECQINQIVDWDEPQARPNRALSNLPNAWDDYVRSDHKNRNWKRFRQTQYKGDKSQRGAFVMML